METVNKDQQVSTPVSAKKTGWRKWLPRIGTFLMMGGWILVLLFAFGILLLISLLSR